VGGLDACAFFNPDLLKPADDNGTRIRVTETLKQSINVIPIP